MVERARYAAEAANALEKEEEFLLNQAIASCRMRIESDRIRPIDSICRVLIPDLCWGQTEPVYKILQTMTTNELQSLLTEIKEFKVQGILKDRISMVLGVGLSRDSECGILDLHGAAL